MAAQRVYVATVCASLAFPRIRAYGIVYARRVLCYRTGHVYAGAYRSVSLAA